jgi:hypothetical protein
VAGGERRAKLVLIGAGLPVLAVLIWGAVLIGQRLRLEEGLERAVHMYQIGYASHIRLDEFTDFAWELFYVFPPYTSEGEIERALGFNWLSVRFTTIEVSDSVNLLVFVREGRVVRWLEFPRGAGEFGGIAPLSPLTPGQALFILVGDQQQVFHLLETK